MKKPNLPKLKINIGKKSVFRYFLISYIAVFLVPVIISIFMYTGTIDISRKETVEKNLMISQQFKYSAEQILIRIENICAKINSDRSLGSLNFEDESISVSERYSLLKDISKLKDYILTENDFIESVYLFRNDKSIALGTNGLYSLKRLYSTSFSTSNLDYNRLTSILKNKESLYIPYSELNINGIKEEYILCILPVKKDVYYSNWSHILLTISKDRFAGKLETSNSKADIFIINKHDEIISLFGNTKSFDIKYNELNESLNTKTDKWQGKQKIITYLKSDLTDFKYVMIEPVSSYLDSVYYIRNLIILGFLLAFLIGLFIIYKFSKRNYEKIKKIADLFGEDENKKNELEYINERVLNSLSLKNELESLKEKTKNEKKDLLITDLLRGTKYLELNDEEYAKTVSKEFSGSLFTVVVLSPDETDDIYFEKALTTLNEKLNDVNFIIKNTISEVFKAPVVFIDGVYAAVIDKEIEADLLKENLTTLINFYRENFNIVITVAFGTEKNGANAIKKSYEEALLALNFKFIKGKGECISYSDTLGSNSNFIYSIEMEQNIINYVKIGSFTEIEKIIREIFDDNFKRNTIPVEMAKCFIFDILGTILKVMPKTETGEYLIEKNDVVNELMTSGTISETEEIILTLFKEICEYNSIIISDNAGSVSKEIEEYIKENFKNPDLNISLIADRFNLSGAYISKLFKTSSGISILDYIHMERLALAKKLLKEGANVNEVAEAVGYNNSNAFIRVFKKYEKITPGQFGKN